MLKTKIGVVGLGYVGLPLAIEFGKKYKTLGIDISKNKIAHYKKCIDPAGEVKKEEFKASQKLTFSSDPKTLKNLDFIIICVPTPVNDSNLPDFTALKKSSEMVSRHMKSGVTIVYESTVYPGATEEICIPILEKFSKLKWRKEFNVGYSPERINPGDKERKLTKITKVVSGDNKKTLNLLAKLYGSIIEAGIYRAPSIKVAEAAKVIENTQRDLNIALVNELSILFAKLKIDTKDVLEAAGTKWNFLPFTPGLVGGHCIGVDPYYLTYKASLVNYQPEVILAGRRINDFMPTYVVQKIEKEILSNKNRTRNIKVIVLGLTFKENCSDLRNSKVLEIIDQLKSIHIELFIHDPLVSNQEIRNATGLKKTSFMNIPQADILILSVNHDFYNARHNDVLSLVKKDGLIIDIKGFIDKGLLHKRGIRAWRL